MTPGSGCNRLSLLLLLALSACGARYLQTAQDSFDKGVAIENRLTLAGAAAVPASASPMRVPPTPNDAAVHYQDARKNVCAALSRNSGDLVNDNMTVQALLILAMTNARLDGLLGKTDDSADRCSGHDYRNAARAAIKDAVAAAKTEPPTPEQSFLLEFLPGLLDHNSGLRKTADAPKSASDDFGSAFATMGKAGAGIDTRTPPIDAAHPAMSLHQMRAYGLLSQIQTLKARYAAVQHAVDPVVATSTERLTDDQRKACADALVRAPGFLVVQQLMKFDPDGALVGPATLKDLRNRPMFNVPGHFTTACPWPR
jgi:hypothetical protein